MTAADLAQLDYQLAHAIKWTLEGIIGAAFLAFLWMVAPYIRGPKP